jgi:hypothetical protein
MAHTTVASFFVLLASSGMILTNDGRRRRKHAGVLWGLCGKGADGTLVYGNFGYNLIQIGWGVAADTEVEGNPSYWRQI